MIDLGWLADRGLLDHAELAPAEEAGIEHRMRCLKLAFESFSTSRDAAFTKSYKNFVEQNQGWLADFSLFMALSAILRGGPPGNSGLSGFGDQNRRAHQGAVRLARSIAQLDFDASSVFFEQRQALRDYAACPGSDPVRRHSDFCRR